MCKKKKHKYFFVYDSVYGIPMYIYRALWTEKAACQPDTLLIIHTELIILTAKSAVTYPVFWTTTNKWPSCDTASKSWAYAFNILPEALKEWNRLFTCSSLHFPRPLLIGCSKRKLSTEKALSTDHGNFFFERKGPRQYFPCRRDSARRITEQLFSQS